MKKHIILFIVGLLALGILFAYFLKELQNAESLKKSTDVTIEYSPAKQMLQSVESQYDLNKMVIKLQLADEYNQLDVNIQFAVLEYFNRQLRYILRNVPYANSIHNLKLEIIGKTDSNIYQLTNVVPKNNMFLNSFSRFFKDGKSIYSTNQMRNKVSIYREEDSFNQQTKEILQYSERFFNILTKNGRYYKAERDDEVIINVVCNKFNITPEEYSQIYLDYYFHFTK